MGDNVNARAAKMNINEQSAADAISDGYCWCDMCGFNAKVKAKHRAQIEDEHHCPCCDEVGMMSVLSVADKLPNHVAPDSPMETFSL